MSRLYDRIMAYTDWEAPEDKEDFAQHTVVVADNVAQYVLDNGDTISPWDNQVYYRIPFDALFIEASQPSGWNHLPFGWAIEIRRKESALERELRLMQIRRLVRAFAEHGEGSEPDDESLASETLGGLGSDPTGAELRALRSQPQEYNCRLWLQKDASGLPTDILWFGLKIQDGTLLAWDWEACFDEQYLGIWRVPDPNMLGGYVSHLDAHHERVRRLLDPLFTALTFMSCKNIALLDNPPPPKAPRFKAKGRSYPLCTYKTIKINPMRTEVHYTPDDATPAPKQPQEPNHPLSIWRGHFKDYRDGKGLFGNPMLKGVYWWDQHVRGSIENGININDYEVQAPNNKEEGE